MLFDCENIGSFSRTLVPFESKSKDVTKTFVKVTEDFS